MALMPLYGFGLFATHTSLELFDLHLSFSAPVNIIHSTTIYIGCELGHKFTLMDLLPTRSLTEFVGVSVPIVRGRNFCMLALLPFSS